MRTALSLLTLIVTLSTGCSGPTETQASNDAPTSPAVQIHACDLLSVIDIQETLDLELVQEDRATFPSPNFCAWVEPGTRRPIAQFMLHHVAETPGEFMQVMHDTWGSEVTFSPAPNVGNYALYGGGILFVSVAERSFQITAFHVTTNTLDSLTALALQVIATLTANQSTP